MGETIKLASLKPNKKNPRLIKDHRFQALVKSIKEFPKMMALRPIIYDKTKIILAGNMKYRALEHMGMTEIPKEWARAAADLTEEERDRFLIMDNEHMGENDWEKLANEWDATTLKDWGLAIPSFNDKEAVSFSAKNTKKGCLLKVLCKDQDAANELFGKLLKEGYEVEIK